MAKISVETVYVANKPFRRAIKFNTRDKEFSCEVPEAVYLVTNDRTVTADTFDGCVRAFDEACRRALAAGTKKRKVISWVVASNCYLDTERRYADGESTHYRSSNSGHELRLVVGVYEETETTLDGKTRWGYELLDSSIPRAVSRPASGAANETKAWANTIEWTQEREDWWCALVRKFEGLIVDLHARFADARAMLESVSGEALLLGAGEPTTKGKAKR